MTNSFLAVQCNLISSLFIASITIDAATFVIWKLPAQRSGSDDRRGRGRADVRADESRVVHAPDVYEPVSLVVATRHHSAVRDAAYKQTHDSTSERETE